MYGVTRLSVGDLRFPRIHEGSLQGASGAAPSISSGNGASAEAAAAEREEPENHVEAEPERRREHEQRPLDETDVEHAVYDRLYGQRGRRD